MLDIAKEVLQYFKGANGVIALVALLLMVAITIWINSTKAQKRKLKVLIVNYLIIICLAAIAMVVWRQAQISRNRFGIEETGVLVLRITGDSGNSLQYDLINSLRDNLKNAPFASNIVVHASDEELDDSKLDQSASFQKAREIGKRVRAQVVIWGVRVGERKFWPRIALVNSSDAQFFSGERVLSVQDISDVKLPAELVNEPIILTLFVTGYLAQEKDDYRKALEMFQSATNRVLSDPRDLAPLQFEIGDCCLHLSQNEVNGKELLSAAIEQFRAASSGFGKTNSPAEWAAAENNLGLSLEVQSSRLSGGESWKYQTNAVSTYENLLKSYDPDHTPELWALCELNLGGAIAGESFLAAGRPDDNGRELMKRSQTDLLLAANILLRKRREQEWGVCQLDLGMALLGQAKRSHGKARQQSLARAALSLENAKSAFTKERSPEVWIMIQIDYGLAMEFQGETSTGQERRHLMTLATNAFQSAITLSSEKFPECRTAGEMNLASLFIDVSQAEPPETGDRLLTLAIQNLTNALSISPRNECFDDWINIKLGLGNALGYQGKSKGGEEGKRLLDQAILAYEEILQSVNQEESPHVWALAELDLASTLRDRATRATNQEARKLLDKATDACWNSLQIFTKENWPEEWGKVEQTLGSIFEERSKQSTEEIAALWLAQSVIAFQRSLGAIDRNEDWEGWALAQINLGNGLCEQANHTSTPDALHIFIDAEFAVKEAVKVLDQNGSSAEWAAACVDLGRVLLDRSRYVDGEKRQELLTESIAAFRKGLSVLTKEESHVLWATAEVDLGIALWEQAGRLNGKEREHSLIDAEKICREALASISSTSDPQIWAMCQMDLGEMLLDQANSSGEPARKDLLVQALTALNHALEVFTEMDFPAPHGEALANIEKCEGLLSNQSK